ncbi:MAG: VirB8/TrbF family protein [Magnetospirillum sp.]|nr:VirB8/TrbF family protein [Magnetospirillum sp.]
MAKKADPARTPTPSAPEDPYKAGRKAWDQAFGGYIADRNWWRWVAAGCLVIAGISAADNMARRAGEHIVPWVVQVDKLGNPVVSGPAEQSGHADPKVITAQLARWVYDVRTVYADVAAEKKIITEGYTMIIKGTPANEKLNDYMGTHDPFERAKKETVGVQVESVLPIAGKVWRADWKETRYAPDGSVLDITERRTDITVDVYPPKDEQTLFTNPSGVYVTDFTWTKKQ